jgi:ubiquinone/menaquinone biosynthesis C-methylase UbiE
MPDTPITTRSETSQWYDRLSHWYDWLSSPWEGPFRRAGLKMLDLQPGESVLELGPGTGHGVSALAIAAGAGGSVYGLDLSARMVHISHQRVRREGRAGRVLLMVGDAARLPYRVKSFDAIFMSFVLELFSPEEIPTVLGECRQVLRPGGRLCAVSMTSSGKSFLMRGLYERAQRRFPRLIDCRPIHLAQSLEAAGFALRRTTCHSSLDLPVEIVLAAKD